MNRFVKYVLPLLAYCLLIYYFSSLSGSHNLDMALSDKALHVIVYSGLGFLFARSINLRKNKSDNLGSFILLSTLFCGFYGVSDEVHQLFVEGRSFEPGDMIADTAGGALGATIFFLMRDLVHSGRFARASRLLRTNWGKT